MRIIFDDFANEEYKDAIEYYEIEIKGLGKRYKTEIKRALRTIRKYPTIGSLEGEDIRRHFTQISL